MEQRKGAYFTVLINSTVLFIVANILETTLHECGHFFTALAFNAKDLSLHHNYVSFDSASLSLSDHILVSSAGPLVSLLLGIIFQILCNRRLRKDLWFMFMNYMSIFGYVGFFGYLMIAPFFAEGDTGYVFQALGFPLWTVIIISLFSIWLLYIFMARLTKNFVALAPEQAMGLHHSRAQFMYILIFYPLIAGIIVTTFMNLPVVTLLSLIAPICRPFTILWTFSLAMKKEYRGIVANDEFKNISAPSWMVFASLLAVILLNRFLVEGLSI